MIKIAIILCVATAISASGYGAPGYDYSAPTPYAFGYNAVGGDGASSRRESGDGHGNVRGSYSLAVGDGRKRVVEYVADGAGFRANVKTNEPGTDNQNPADVNVAAAPSYAYGHGLHGAGSYAAPAVYGGYGYGGYGYGGYGGAYGGYGYGLGGYGGYGYGRGFGGYGGYGYGRGLGGYGGYGYGRGLGGYGGYGYATTLGGASRSYSRSHSY